VFFEGRALNFRRWSGSEFQPHVSGTAAARADGYFKETRFKQKGLTVFPDYAKYALLLLAFVPQISWCQAPVIFPGGVVNAAS
jgi:hypothetical protein